ncbi:MAG: GNAT family N-acetyltransferase [Bacteroidota bacterium]
MEIRSANRGDLHAIVALCKLHGEYEKAAYDTSNKADLLSKHFFEDKSLQCYVVEHDSEIVGYATFMKQFSTWDATFYIYLDCLFLKAEVRGMGIGTSLMDKIKAYAKKENCNIIQWQTPDFNKKAIAFYQKIGGISKTKERFFMQVSNSRNWLR